MSKSRRSAIRRARDRLTTNRSVDDLAEEALLLVSAAVRLAAKNFLILRVMRVGEPFDETELADLVRGELTALLEERSEEARRLRQARHRALFRGGWAITHDDYRRLDLPTLRLRERVARAIATRLAALLTDDDYLRSIIDRARDSALDEIMLARIIPVRKTPPDGRYRVERDARMSKLRDDLEELQTSAIALEG